MRTFKCKNILFAACLFFNTVEAQSESLLNIFSGKKQVNHQQFLIDTFNRVKEEYVEDVSEKALAEASIQGMLNSLDPYSSFLDERATTDFMDYAKGEISGIGVEITMDKGHIKVITPYKNGPAYNAGIISGDVITAIDQKIIKNSPLSEVADKLRGPVGSKLSLTIHREENSEIFNIEVVRAIVKLTPVHGSIMDDIAYINIPTFNEKTAEEVKKQYEQLSKGNINPIKGVILDMRWNPGGLFDQAIATTELFLKDGLIVSTRGRTPESEENFYAVGEDITGGLPLVILINGATASSPEIVTGALQDNKRAIVLGTKTFGKASMQSIIYLGHGVSIKLTTAKYYTPNGTLIHGIGIQPDIVVSEEEAPTQKKSSLASSGKRDVQLLRAISLINSMPVDSKSTGN